LASQGNLSRIIGPTYFVSDNKAEKMFVGIIIATQVPQALCAFKSQNEIVLDVGGFHLAPNMTIILTVHALHLSKMASWKTDGWQFKDDVIIECHGQRGNILNLNLVIVQ
jgi:hypothetical protein